MGKEGMQKLQERLDALGKRVQRADKIGKTKEQFKEKFNLHDSCDCVLFLAPNNGKLPGKPRIKY